MTVLDCTHPSEDRYEQTRYDMSITVGRATMEEIPIEIAISVAAVGTITKTGDRDSIITEAVQAEIDARETGTTRTGGQAETMGSGEGTGVVA